MVHVMVTRRHPHGQAPHVSVSCQGLSILLRHTRIGIKWKCVTITSASLYISIQRETERERDRERAAYSANTFVSAANCLLPTRWGRYYTPILTTPSFALPVCDPLHQRPPPPPPRRLIVQWRACCLK